MTHIYKHMLNLRANPGEIPQECWLQATGSEDPDRRMEFLDTRYGELVHRIVSESSVFQKDRHFRKQHQENLDLIEMNAASSKK